MLQHLVPGDIIITFSPNKMQWQNEFGVHLLLSGEDDLLGCAIYDFHPCSKHVGHVLILFPMSTNQYKKSLHLSIIVIAF
jgi:hypothetical protein